MTDDIVSEIIRRRNVRPFSSVSEIRDLISDDNVLNNMLTVKSFIFRIEATATVDNASVTITAYYSRDDKKILYWAEE
jgi:type II secretory pathway component PulK